MMLGELLGIRVVLLMGATVPLPASPEVTAALSQVQVTSDARMGDGFQMTFTIGRELGPDFSLVGGGALDPFRRVIIAVAIGVQVSVLIDGIITNQEVSASTEPGQSTLTVTGKDLTVLMDLEERSRPFRNQPDGVIALQVLAPYARHGIVPAPTQTTDVPIEIQRVPRQQETDLRFLERLARRNGFVFYLEPVTIGVTTAYWGPENRLGIPQPALTVGMGAAANVPSLRVATDAMAPVAAAGKVVEPFLKLPLPVPAMPALRIPPLATSPVPARRTTVLRESGNQSVGQALQTSVARATEAPDPVTASGEIDTVRYGHVLRSRGLVGVRGAGITHDGLYYVKRVSHTIRDGQYRQSFSLSREGTGTSVPVVRP